MDGIEDVFLLPKYVISDEHLWCSSQATLARDVAVIVLCYITPAVVGAIRETVHEGALEFASARAAVGSMPSGAEQLHLVLKACAEGELPGMHVWGPSSAFMQSVAP